MSDVPNDLPSYGFTKEEIISLIKEYAPKPIALDPLLTVANIKDWIKWNHDESVDQARQYVDARIAAIKHPEGSGSLGIQVKPSGSYMVRTLITNFIGNYPMFTLDYRKPVTFILFGQFFRRDVNGEFSFAPDQFDSRTISENYYWAPVGFGIQECVKLNQVLTDKFGGSPYVSPI